ncbi:MAG TPA: hypothetical protein VF469_10310, partial [Kofleriaceae bacterium]
LRDGRVPCPLCGGLLHPVAGKCKHCKADLAAYRTVRPAANAPLPALSQPAQPVNSQHMHAPDVQPAPVPPVAPAAVGLVGYDAAQPVLPPRPPGQMHTSQPVPSAWRSWPIFVIVVAMMAIVAAVVLMVWPSHGQGSKRALQPPPAPERMDTQTPPVTPKIDAPATSQPPQGSADPWGMRTPAPRDPSAALDPPNDTSGGSVPAAPARATDPVDPANPDLDALDPIHPPYGSASPRRRLSLNRTGMVAGAMRAHLCQKLVDCAHGDAQTRRACSPGTSMPDALLASCPAARRCLESIDAMSCADRVDAAQINRLLRLTDCLDAMRC